MPRFDYFAVNASGQELTGQADGADSAEVSESLRRDGWTVLSIQPSPEQTSAFSAQEGIAFSQQLVAATQAGLPLSGALRAFSDEVSSARLRLRLVPVCEALERGEALNQNLLRSILGLSPSLAMILNSGLPQAAISGMLVHAIQSEATLRELKWRVIVLAAYPLCILTAFAGLWAILLLWIVPMYHEVFTQFSTTVSPALIYLMNLSTLLQHWDWRWVLGVIAMITASIFVAYKLTSATLRCQFRSAIPFVGSMYRLMAISDLAHLLAVMLECRVPLPRALTWAANGSRDAELTRLCVQVSERIQAGDSMDRITASQISLPAYVEQTLRWAELGQEGAEPLKSLSQMLRLRARMLAESTMPLMEPIMLCGSVVVVIGYVATIFPPLLRLLNDLS